MTQKSAPSREPLWPYLLWGVVLGFVFTRSEVVSWFRIQEMFRFHDFHMYGIIGSAVAVGAAGIALLKRFEVKASTGEQPRFPTDDFRAPGT